MKYPGSSTPASLFKERIEKVTEMESTFSGCLSLTGEIIINAKNIEKYDGCFDWTELPITLKGSSPYLAELAATSNNGNVTVD